MENTATKEMIPATGFAALKDFNLAEALADEMTGLNVSFDRIPVPIGGGTSFEVPGELPGETDTVKEFSGVILLQHPLNAYYRTEYQGGNNPPDCGSYDGITGVGNPGGSCARCPLNEFDSGANGGKACKNKRRIFLLREGEVFPAVLTLPSGSVKDFGLYIKRLLNKGRRSNAVVTRFSLKKASNAGGKVYSQVQFVVDRPLTEEELPMIAAMTEHVKQVSARVGYEDEQPTTSDYVIDPETGEIIREEALPQVL